MREAPVFGRRVGRRVVYRRSKRILLHLLGGRWRGPRHVLDRMVRGALRRKSAGYLLRLARSRAFALGVAAMLLAGAPSYASPPINLSDIAQDGNDGGFVVIGRTTDGAGALSSAGDVNGDGIPDFLVGMPGADPNAYNSGKAYLVFGKTTGTSMQLSEVESGLGGGFVMNGHEQWDLSGGSVSGAGDVNGDGVDDFIIGSGNAAGIDGKSYVVFGRTSTAPIDLSDVGTSVAGFKILPGPAGRYSQSGTSVSGAGDINGDGLTDLIVGAPGYYIGALNTVAGKAFVVFGKSSTVTVSQQDLTLGVGGFPLKGDPVPRRQAAGAFAGGDGDVNGDGIPDILLGARGSGDLSPGERAGRTFVVFGKLNTSGIQLSDVTSGIGGFVIEGAQDLDYANRVTMAGDVNGDGLADIVIGTGLTASSEVSYVVFGKINTSPVELSQIASNGNAGGFVINGESSGDNAGRWISGAGDVNGDGLADIVVSARGAYVPGAGNAGRAYVVFGKATGTAVELSAIAAGAGGFAIDGVGGYEYIGSRVSGAGDMNGDGLADLLVSAHYNRPVSTGKWPLPYVVFSPETAAPTATYKIFTRRGDGAGGRLVPPTEFDDARFTVDFSDNDNGHNGFGGASLETVTIHRSTAGLSNFPSNLAGVYWEFSTIRVGWSHALMTIRYLESEVAALGVSEGLMVVYVATDPAGPWFEIPTTVDTVRNRLSFVALGGANNFLLAIGTPKLPVVWADFAHVGAQAGTQALPVNTLQDALAIVEDGGTINIKGDTALSDSPEALTIDAPVTVNAVGGTVRIGSP